MADGSVVHLACGGSVELHESVEDATRSLLGDDVATLIVTQPDHRDRRVSIVAAHITHITEAPSRDVVSF